MPRANLFEIETVIEDPANLNTADAEYVVTASDSMDYVVKTPHRHPGWGADIRKAVGYFILRPSV